MNTTTLTQTSQTEFNGQVENLALYRGRESTHQISQPPARRLRPSETRRPTSRNDTAAPPHAEENQPHTVLLRCELGGVLRDNRLRQRRTLRDVATAAKISLGYLSEVERGHKEASSELVASICEALNVPLWETLREVCERVAMVETEIVPPAPFSASDSKHLHLTSIAI